MKTPAAGNGFGMPLDASADGWRIDHLFHLSTVLIGAVFLVMVGWMVLAIIRFSGRRRHTERRAPTGRTSVFVTLGVAGLVFVVVDGTMLTRSLVDVQQTFWNFDRAEAHPRAVRIQVNARQWAWDARYAGPDGRFNTPDDIVTLNDLRVPVGVPVIVQLAATDVIHSFYLPHFRVKQDAVPGQINRLWFQAKRTGTFEIACAEHCGVHHYKMRGLLTVLPPDEYAAWWQWAADVATRAHDPDDLGAHWGWEWRRGHAP